MIYQHPLAYLLGLEGVALLRAFAGEYDEDFAQARINEVQQLLASIKLFGDGAHIPPITSVDGYQSWAAVYDDPGNAMIDVEQPIVREILDGIPTGIALDAACGTGRHADYLATRGHHVIAVDNSPDMLARARLKVPDAEFHEADVHALPLPDDHVDVVVCTLALSHVPHLAAALAELTRVLRPGGHLVISDAAGLAAGLRPPIVMTGPDGRPGYLPHVNRKPGDYLRAALPLGLQVRRCEEPRLPEPYVDPDYHPPIEDMLPDGPPNIWWLHHWFPAATNAALRDEPVALILHFQLAG